MFCRDGHILARIHFGSLDPNHYQEISWVLTSVLEGGNRRQTMKAALYARVSLDKQRENYSIPTQLEAMREYCQRNNWEVIKEYVEDESGAKLNRPALDQVREDIAQGLFDVLVCHDVDRFGRNLGHQILLEQEFAKQGVSVRYVIGDYKDTPEGKLTKHIKGVIAEYEREKITERTFRGRLGRAKSGQVNITSCSPYGYAYKSEGRRGWLEIVSEEAEIVREMYCLYVHERLSCHEIAGRLTRRQVPTRTGSGEWSPSTIKGILGSETYAGVWHDNKHKRGKGTNPTEDWIAVSVPPLVSRELWEAAQVQIATNRERLRRRPKYPYLLSGILRCGSCGRAFTGTTSVPSRGRKAYHYYRCADRSRTWKHERCLETKIHSEEADALVWDKIAEALRNPQLLVREYSRQVEDGSDANIRERLGTIEREVGKIKRQQQRNLDLYVEGLVDMRSLKARQGKLRVQQASLEREKTALERKLGRNNAQIVPVSEFCQLISQALDSVTFDEKRQILYLLNIEGRVKDATITLTGCIPYAQNCGYRAPQFSAPSGNHLG